MLKYHFLSLFLPKGQVSKRFVALLSVMAVIDKLEAKELAHFCAYSMLSMQHIPSLEANRSSARQDIIRILRK